MKTRRKQATPACTSPGGAGREGSHLLQPPAGSTPGHSQLKTQSWAGRGGGPVFCEVSEQRDGGSIFCEVSDWAASPAGTPLQGERKGGSCAGESPCPPGQDTYVWDSGVQAPVGDATPSTAHPKMPFGALSSRTKELSYPTPSHWPGCPGAGTGRVSIATKGSLDTRASWDHLCDTWLGTLGPKVPGCLHIRGKCRKVLSSHTPTRDC